MGKKKIIVGLASCGISAGGDRVYETFENCIKEESGVNVTLAKTGCIGACFREVLVEIEDEKGSSLYADVTPETAKEIFDKHVVQGETVEEHLIKNGDVDREHDFFAYQEKIVLRNIGFIDPEDIDQYIARDGYRAIEKAVTAMTPEKVREDMKKSGLRGRGGAGFLAGRKWDLAAQNESDKKYAVCNADEGDPGAFMDRSIVEGDPHSVIEGLSIMAYAIGSDEGYVYVRAEYPLAIERLDLALEQAREKGFLGKNIFGTDFSFDIKVKVGAGAFVCGEETALMASIEGRRGMPRKRPPFPAKSGVWGKPTIINNVETLANAAYIILHGWEKYASTGTENSTGTKLFALTGKIKKSGLVEVPMGMTLRDVIFKIGGGIKDDKKFKAVQLGGPAGGCIPGELIETKVDYDSLTATGAIMGSGGMVVMDDSTCMVDVAKFFMNFIREESCGKCTFCRIGTTRMYEMLVRITEGKGKEEDLDTLLVLGEKIQEGSLCGLGQAAPNPILTTIRYFKDEYLEHINDKKCRAKICKPLLTYTIDPEPCTGCTLCAKNCPVDVISGERKEAHVISQEGCIKCGNCYTVCNFNAVIVE
ncbi:MAG: NADH-quinone oxidoreductase subunit NuoF [bacterium]|nr:NADH-quinone oxidoreductase subunit NuoF [bacterium]